MQELTLDDVAQSFEEWRSRRTSQSTPIPTRLWALVAKIKNDYPLSKIYQRLRISSLQFHTHVEPHAIDIGSDDFVEVSLAQTTMSQETLPSEITISLQSSSRTLSLNIAPQQIAEVLPHFASLL